MTHRSPARYLAPLALVGFVVALVLVVGGSGNGGEQTAAPTPTPASTAESAQERDRRERRERRREQKKEQETYTVQAGDTPSGIAEETGVPLETLEELNPDLDPQSLAVGDEIRIR
jgi:LysM repeat protein